MTFTPRPDRGYRRPPGRARSRTISVRNQKPHRPAASPASEVTMTGIARKTAHPGQRQRAAPGSSSAACRKGPLPLAARTARIDWLFLRRRLGQRLPAQVRGLDHFGSRAAVRAPGSADRAATPACRRLVCGFAALLAQGLASSSASEAASNVRSDPVPLGGALTILVAACLRRGVSTSKSRSFSSEATHAACRNERMAACGPLHPTASDGTWYAHCTLRPADPSASVGDLIARPWLHPRGPR